MFLFSIKHCRVVFFVSSLIVHIPEIQAGKAPQYQSEIKQEHVAFLFLFVGALSLGCVASFYMNLCLLRKVKDLESRQLETEKKYAKQVESVEGQERFFNSYKTEIHTTLKGFKTDLDHLKTRLERHEDLYSTFLSQREEFSKYCEMTFVRQKPLRDY